MPKTHPSVLALRCIKTDAELAITYAEDGAFATAAELLERAATTAQTEADRRRKLLGLPSIELPPHRKEGAVNAGNVGNQ